MKKMALFIILILIIVFAYIKYYFRLDKDFIIFDRGDNYIVYEHVDSFTYYYEIMDNNNVFFKSELLEKTPNFQVVSDNILEMKLNYGSYANISKYYDINRRIESIEYQNVLLVHKDLCVYIEPRKIVIVDIFNPDKYNKEYDLGVMISPTTIDEINFINDNKLRVSYYDNNGLLQEVLIEI